VKSSGLIQDKRIHLFEEHSSSLPVWWAQHDSPRTVVYVDAHLDLQQTSDNTLAALRACTTLEDIRSLEAPNHLNPAGRYAFGIENFLYAAHHLKLIDRLVWVAPAHIPRHYSRALIAYVQQMDGISFDELTGFQMIGHDVMQGSLLGLDITICDYDGLGSLGIDSNYYLDIDIDYFVEVPSDRLWIDPAAVVNTIMAQLGSPSLVTISRAVSSGFTPLAYRFIGDYIYSLLNDREAEYDYYHQLAEVVREMGDGDLGRGQGICRQLIKDQPELAAAYYILALGTADAGEKKRLLDMARSCDSAYGFDLAREAIGLLNRKKNLDADKLRQLTAFLDNQDMAKSQREQAEVALAKVFSASGNIESARSLLARLSGDYADHEDVLLDISARQLGDPAKHEPNKEMLGSVTNGVKNATVASVYLGDLEFSNKNYEASLEHYRLAQKRAPAWMLPLERMLACYQQLGMGEETGEIEQRILRRKQRLEKIIQA